MKTSLFILIALAFAGLLGFLTYQNGMTHFGGFDHALLVDVGWRQYIGQKPYVDFVCTVPPWFALESKWAMQFWGPYWSSLVKVSVIQTVCVFLGIAMLMRRLLVGHAKGREERMLVELFALITACMFAMGYGVYYGFFWHGVEGQLFAVLLALMALAWTDKRGTERKGGAWDGVILAMLTGALSGSKPNAILFSLPCVMGFLWIKKQGLALRWMFAGTLMAWSVYAWNGFDPMSVLSSYASVSGRALAMDGLKDLQLSDPGHLLMDGAWFAPALFFVISFLKQETNKSTMLLVLGLVLTGAYSMVSNIESTLPSWLTLAMGMWILAVPSVVVLMPRTKTMLGVIMVMVVLSGSFSLRGFVRERVQAMGPHFYHRALLPRKRSKSGFQMEHHVVLRTGFFRDMMVSEALLQTLMEDEQFSCLVGAPKVYGPHLQWMYAMRRRASPKHVPLWWHPGSSHAFAESLKFMEREIAHGSRLHMRGDTTYYDEAEVALLLEKHRILVNKRTQYFLPHGAEPPDRAKIKHCKDQAMYHGTALVMH